MKLFSYRIGQDQYGIGIEKDNGIFDVSRAFDIYQHSKRIPQPVSFVFLQVLVEMGMCSGEAMDQVFSEPWVQSKQEALRLKEGYIIELPVSRPSKIVCLGRNYQKHIQELDHEIPREPLFFAKATSSLLPHEGEIVIPRWLNGRVDHEAELGIVIGQQGKNISESNAYDYIAGYTIINDVTARDIQKNDIEHGNPWYRSKSLDTFCPAGPYLVPVDRIDDPHQLEIKLTVNGEIRQQNTTANMIFKIPRIIAEISKYMTLMPGDIIATGTPEGVSPIQNGDEIEVSISGLGTLRNRVVVGS